jgi:hypothetical protein
MSDKRIIVDLNEAELADGGVHWLRYDREYKAKQRRDAIRKKHRERHLARLHGKDQPAEDEWKEDASPSWQTLVDRRLQDDDPTE